jgi:hypothetical protein
MPAAMFAQSFQVMPQVKLLPRLDQQWSAQTALPTGTVVRGTASSPQLTCSIPLLVIPPRDVDAQMIVATPSAVEPNMPQINPPAPPCPRPAKRYTPDALGSPLGK